MRLTCLFIILVIFNTPLEAAELHAILVADTLGANISHTVKADLEKIEGEIARISLFANLPIRKYLKVGEEINLEDLLYSLQTLPIQEDDVVLFYFSGHGYRTKKKESPWPNLYVTCENRGIDFDLIVAALESKTPRLMIVFADVCNDVVPHLFAPPLVTRSLKIYSFQTILDAYATLFRHSRGKILLAGAKSGEYAWARANGALLTSAWLYCMAEEIQRGATASWQNLIERAIIKIQAEQNPYFYIELQ